jgi:hypothetical protein
MKVNFVYFVDKNFEDCLKVSLKSLRKVKPEGEIYIWTDKDNPVDVDAEVVKRKDLIGSGRNPQSVLEELLAFRKISDCDYICRVDADVVWLKGDVFERLEGDIAGHRCTYWKPYVYPQGGCYFLSSYLVDKVDKLDLDIFNKTENLLKKSGKEFKGLFEDQVIFNIYRKHTDKIQWIDFMDGYRGCEGGSIKHIQGNKSNKASKMKEVYENRYGG